MSSAGLGFRGPILEVRKPRPESESHSNKEPQDTIGTQVSEA